MKGIFKYLPGINKFFMVGEPGTDEIVFFSEAESLLRVGMFVLAHGEQR